MGGMSIRRSQVLFIDGLPGSGKSTAAAAIGGRLPHSRVFLETTPDHPLLPVMPDRMGAAFADITSLIRGSRLPPQRSASWKSSWRRPQATWCTSSRAIPYRARFGCSSSSTRPGRRSCSSGRICRTAWLQRILDWSTSKNAIPCKPLKTLRDSGGPLGKAIWSKPSGNRHGCKRVAFPLPTAWSSGSSSMRTWSIDRHGHGNSPC